MSQVLEYVYNWFGVHRLPIFQDIEERDEQANRDRVKFFLGQHYIDDTYVLEKSIYERILYTKSKNKHCYLKTS